MKIRFFRCEYTDPVSQWECSEWIEDAQDKETARQIFRCRFGFYPRKITGLWK